MLPTHLLTNTYKYINRAEYKVFKKMEHIHIKDIYDKVYIKLSEIIKTFDITVFGCKVDETKFKYLFETSQKILEDPYNIALQVIIENFTHFLNNKNGVGYIVYESRNAESNADKKSPDIKMYENFCKIKSVSKGIPYINQNSITNRIRYFDIVRKITENPGLEFADFIAFNLYKSFFVGDTKDKTEFMKKIEKSLYNGGFSQSVKDLRCFYGVRNIPEDYETINFLNKELDRLKRAYKNLKNEKEKLSSKNTILKQEKDQIKEQNKLLQEEINTLKSKSIEIDNNYQQNNC